MMKKSKYALLMALTLVVSVFLAACGNGSDKKTEEGTTSNAGQEIKVLSDAEIPTMDSVKVTDHVGITYLNAVNEGLIFIRPRRKPYTSYC